MQVDKDSSAPESFDFATLRQNNPILVKMTKIDDFGGPAHLAWTPPKFCIMIKMARAVKKLG